MNTTDKGKRRDDSSCPSKNSVNTTVSCKEDDVWSAFDPADLFDDDVSIINTTATDSNSSSEGLFDTS